MLIFSLTVLLISLAGSCWNKNCRSTASPDVIKQVIQPFCSFITADWTHWLYSYEVLETWTNEINSGFKSNTNNKHRNVDSSDEHKWFVGWHCVTVCFRDTSHYHDYMNLKWIKPAYDLNNKICFIITQKITYLPLTRSWTCQTQTCLTIISYSRLVSKNEPKIFPSLNKFKCFCLSYGCEATRIFFEVVQSNAFILTVFFLAGKFHSL
jgi:hypothetical protein